MENEISAMGDFLNTLTQYWCNSALEINKIWTSLKNKIRNKIENNILAFYKKKKCCFYTDKSTSDLLEHLFLYLTNALFTLYSPKHFLHINKKIVYCIILRNYIIYKNAYVLLNILIILKLMYKYSNT